MFSVSLLLECTVSKALGCAVPALGFGKEAAVTGYPKEMCLFLTGCGICFIGDDDFDQEHCTKMLLHQIQQLLLNICLLQHCPLPILSSLPKESVHWRADSSAQ